MGKQVYLNLGQFLLGLAFLGIDARTMEGIEKAVVDEEFNLNSTGYGSVVVVSIGYRDLDKDFNAKLPKSRLPESDFITEV